MGKKYSYPKQKLCFLLFCACECVCDSHETRLPSSFDSAPAYMAEICPPQIRGAVVSAKETVIVTGMVLGYVTRNMVSQTSPRWTDLYALSVVIAFPMFLMTFYIPRSKRWLLLQGLRDEAYGSMQFVYKGNVRDAFEQLEAQIREVSSTNTTPQESLSIASLLFSPQNESAMTASMGLILFQQMSGKPSVLSYTTVLFEAAGRGGNASVVTALLVLAMSISTVLIVDRVGRKPLLRVCCGTMMIASFLLGACFFWFDKSSETELEGLPRIIVLVAMCVCT
jgi:SP family arabinose:H+ symporter-like MFS transporter